MTPALAPQELTAQVLFAEQEIGRLQLALKDAERRASDAEHTKSELQTVLVDYQDSLQVRFA
jgi:hypothetical protein